ncbi:MAG: TatD family hydrolase [Patescibacteria group bacterium]
MLIDTHCHLNFEAFEKDYREVAKRCQEKGMKVITVGSQMQNSKKAADMSHEFDFVFGAVGLHPTHINDEEFSPEEYLKLAKDNKVVAVGETGLDYYQMWAESKEEEARAKEGQKELLKKHLGVARQAGVPVILHCRDAYEDLIALMKEEEEIPAVVHCFLSSREIARRLLALGFYLGFTGIITFTDDQELFSVVKEVPLEKMFIETDAPYLAPQAYRGKRCEPIYVVEVAKKIAELKNIPVEKVVEQTGKNAEGFFKI